MKKQPTSEHRWYVYAYIDPRPEREGEFIYIGKGTHDGGRRLQRMESHWLATSLGNPLFSRVLAKIRGLGLEPVRTVVAWYKSEKAAFEGERRNVALHGLRRDGGALCNLTFGGEGPEGYQHTKKSKKKIGAAAKEVWQTTEYRAKWVAAHKAAGQRPEVKEAKSKVSKERWADPAFKAKNTELIRKAKTTPEALKNASQKSNAYWAAPENRKKFSERMREVMLRSEKVKALWADPAFRDKMRAASAAARAKKSGMFHTASGTVQ